MEINIPISLATVLSLSLASSALLNVVAQDHYSGNSSRSSNRGDYSDGTTPTTAILIILICLFFAAGFIFIYLRHYARCLGFHHLNGRGGGPPWRRESTRGVDPDVIATFPTFLYSQVKAHRIGTTPLECAVCLNEFSHDDDKLMLLPGCSHVFHPECIDPWLAHHITCPICRAILPQSEPSLHNPLTLPPQIHNDSYDRNHEGQVTIPVIGPQTDMTNTGDRFRKLKRSHSTGHSLREEGDRFTLRLSQEVPRVTYYTNVDALASALISPRLGYRTIRAERWRLSVSPPFIVPRREEMSRRSLSPKSEGDGYANVMQQRGVPSPLKRVVTQLDDIGERSSDWLRHSPHG